MTRRVCSSRLFGARPGCARAAGVRALTIVELVLSLAIMAVLLAGIASAMVIASRVITSADSPLRPVADGAFSIDRMLVELQTAKSISELSTTAITAVVSDVTGDALDDTIRFAWSGTRDTPLTRQVNGGSIVNLVPSVRGFALGYSPYAKTTTTAQVTENTSGSLAISSFSGWVGVTLPLAQTWNVSSSNWVALQFQPFSTVPYDAKSITITSATFTARGASATSTLSVGIYPTGPTNTYPSTPIIGTAATLNTSSISSSSYSDVTVPFTDVMLDNPFAGYALRLHTNSATNTLSVRGWYGALLAPANDSIGEQSSNSGASWTPTSNIDAYDAPHTITGTYTTEARTHVNETRYYLRSISAAAVVSDGVALQQSEVLLNEPDVTGLWTPAVNSDQSLIDVILNLVGGVLRLL